MATKLLKLCPSDIDEINEWIQNINQNEEHSLHRECACIEPSEDNILEILNERGLQAFSSGNDIGITAARYLEENPFIEIDQHELINWFVLNLIGEISQQ